jgi:hypothetical protein
VFDSGVQAKHEAATLISVVSHGLTEHRRVLTCSRWLLLRKLCNFFVTALEIALAQPAKFEV